MPNGVQRSAAGGGGGSEAGSASPAGSASRSRSASATAREAEDEAGGAAGTAAGAGTGNAVNPAGGRSNSRMEAYAQVRVTATCRFVRHADEAAATAAVVPRWWCSSLP